MFWTVWVALCGPGRGASPYYGMDSGLELRQGYQQDSIEIRITLCRVGLLIAPVCTSIHKQSECNDCLFWYTGVFNQVGYQGLTHLDTLCDPEDPTRTPL